MSRRGDGKPGHCLGAGMSNALSVTWLDFEREPRCAPDPDYPDGKDLDLAPPWGRTCETDLPYPAKRCGAYVVGCSICGQSVAITTAGRPDDPRHVRLPCRIGGNA